MERIYHPYWKWEDHKNGFYDNCSGQAKTQHIKNVLEMFNSEELTIEYMNKVVEEWIFSCEHNLTNPALNKVAYIGQSACCIYKGVPATVTMEAWSLLSKEIQERSNKIAESVILKWKDSYAKN